MRKNLIKIEQTMYGDYTCSCGCGKPLVGLCYGVGDEADEEGYEWRMFTKHCWGLGISDLLPEEIFDNYPVSPLNN